MVSAVSAIGSKAAVNHAGELEIELCSGADTEVVRTIIRALRVTSFYVVPKFVLNVQPYCFTSSLDSHFEGYF